MCDPIYCCWHRIFILHLQNACHKIPHWDSEIVVSLQTSDQQSINLLKELMVRIVLKFMIIMSVHINAYDKYKDTSDVLSFGLKYINYWQKGQMYGT